MALLNLLPLIIFWGPGVIFVGLYTNTCCNEWFVSLVMFDLLVILVLVCIFLGQCFILISLTLFIHKGRLPCSPICVFKIWSVTDDHYSPSYCYVSWQPPFTFEHTANGFICGFLLPYSIRLILVTLLYWLNLYLS